MTRKGRREMGIREEKRREERAEERVKETHRKKETDNGWIRTNIEGLKEPKGRSEKTKGDKEEKKRERRLKDEQWRN